MDSARQLCWQSAHPLGFAVQLKLTPELRQALVAARGTGEAVSLRFRGEPAKEAVLSIGSTEHVFRTDQAGLMEVVEVSTRAKGATSIASIKHRLTLQRTPPGGLPSSLAASSLGAGAAPRQRGPSAPGNVPIGMPARSASAADAGARPTPPPAAAAASAGAAAAGNGRGGGMAPPAVSAPTAAAKKLGELPRPRSAQQLSTAPAANGTGRPAAPGARPPRQTPTPPPPELGSTAADGSAAAAAPAGARTANGSGGGSGGSGGGGGSSPVGQAGGGGGGGGGGSGGGAAELPRAAVQAARQGNLVLVIAALLRDQPLTASSLTARIDAIYRAAGAKPEAREYVRRVLDDSCTMTNNRMKLKPEILAREARALDDLLCNASPTTDVPSDRGRSAGARAGAAGGAGSKRYASCSPDPRLSPDQDGAGGGGGGGGGGGVRAWEDNASAGDDSPDGGAPAAPSARPAAAVTAAAGTAAKQGVKRPRAGGPSAGTAAGAGAAAPPRPGQKPGQRPGQAGGRGGGAAAAGKAAVRYDLFDDLTDPPPVPAPPPSTQQNAGRAAAAKATAAAIAASRRMGVASGGPRGLKSHAPTPPATSPAAKAPAAAAAQPKTAAVKPKTSPPRPVPPPAAAVMNGGAPGRVPNGKLGSRAAAPPGGGTAPAAAAAAAAAAPAAAVASPAVMPPATSPPGPTSAGGPVRTASEELGGAPSESAMDTEGGGRGTSTALTATVGGAASPDSETWNLDPEIQAYAEIDLIEDDKDAEWYRSYVDWKPDPRPAVQSLEEYEQYERQYRQEYDVYHRLNLKYNEVVREAEAHRAAVEAVAGAEERGKSVQALWRLGASKWKLLEAWKAARRNLHADLIQLRSRATEYISRQGAA
ncbi:hypothetical protein HYH03_014360 [Edaphochlamys debaryana]|uniref:Uncharacterized protein n=1 Tax=Edaphochlamys debaryana TaxID=47281 RepID=A0A836BTL1_9CHLO|nr:hypothetical protein HYH03_014360 [Edaphochlamys debaryana]|eukprot:KAG2486988.1 hypothetical protein HYH03_014360 [Edaphochlamys debaryana]